MSTRQVISKSGKGKKKRTSFGKGVSGQIKRLQSQVQTVRKAVQKAVEWKRQYFYGNPDYSSVTQSLIQADIGLGVVPWIWCLSDWLFSQGGIGGNTYPYPNGDGINGTTVQPRYMQIGLTLQAGSQLKYNLSTDQLRPLMSYRVVIWQNKGIGYDDNPNALGAVGAHIRLFGKEALQTTVAPANSYLSNPVNCPLSREFGGKGKPCHVLYDEVINPNAQHTGSAIAVNGEHCHTIKIPMDTCGKIQFAGPPSVYGLSYMLPGNNVAYETGPIYIAIFNNWDVTQVVEPIDYMLDVVRMNGMLVYTD